MSETEKMVSPARGDVVVRDKHVNGRVTLLTQQNGNDVTYADEGEQNNKCGLGLFAPKWLQVFASKQAFLATFCITWVLQGMFLTYFVSVITTIEKLFQIQSKTTGIIMSATEIGQIGSSLLLTYYGAQGHRPKWIAWGMVLFAASSFTCSLPHFIFGKQLMDSNEGMFTRPSSLMNTTSVHPLMCDVDDPLGGHNFSKEQCDEGDLAEQQMHSKITKNVLAILFISLLGVGLGQTTVYTLGIPYIDDNVASRESPLYFAITIGVRIVGPAMGFITGAFCTRLYVDLSVDPEITPKDPRWIGAWWLGLVFVSGGLILASLAMFSFPAKLSTCRIADTNKCQRERKNPSLKDFPKVVKRLLKNDILMFRTASSVFHILPIAGLYTFLPKYLESQFRLTAHSANMFSGVGGILVMGIGIILSGVFILRVKPNARFVAAWIAFTAVIYACGMVILMYIGCPMEGFAGLQQEKGISLPTFENPCKLDCDCSHSTFSPICGEDKLTYFSACAAGCQNYTLVKGKVAEFSDCTCMTSEIQSSHSIGMCESECNNFIWYIILFSLFVFIHSTSEVGSMLLILRCVDPKDKAMALALIQFAIGLFGNVPCPIVYGAIVDSACLMWDKVCGKNGACRLYHADTFRYFFHGITAALMLCAFFMDIIVWYKAENINFVDDQVVQEEELDPMTGRSTNV